MGATVRERVADEDYKWRERFKDVDFVVAANPSSEEIDEAVRLFGELMSTRGVDLEEVVIRYPALTVMALAGHAITSYESGAFWDSFWEATGCEAVRADSENILRRKLERILTKCELFAAPELIADSKYVIAIAMHAGVPVHCADDLIDVLEEYIRAGREPSGASFVEWLTDRQARHRATRLDLPVRLFIEKSGDLAINLLDRIIELGARTLNASVVPVESRTTGIPAVLLSQVRARFRSRPFLSHSTAARRDLASFPVLRYSVDENQLVVDLPYPPEGASTPWRVSFGKTVREIYPMAGWGVGDGRHPSTPATVTEVSRDVIAVHEVSGAQASFVLFSTSDPLIVFTPEGRIIKARNPLPRGDLYVLAPHDATLHDEGTGQKLVDLDPPFSILGWVGWCMHRVDIRGCDGLHAQRKGVNTQPRRVEQRGVAEIELPEALSAIRTTSGQRVFGERPLVCFPPYPGTGPQTWRVSTRVSGTSGWITDQEWESGDVPTYADPFDGIEEALLGLFDVQVRSGVAKDVHRTVFIAEGLYVDAGEDVRLPEPGGLSEGVVTISSDYDLQVEPGILVLGRAEREKTIRVDSGTTSLELVVSPPCAEFRIDKVDHPAEWRTAPKSLSPEDFAERSTVAVRVNGATRAEFVVEASNGQRRLTEPAKPKPQGVFAASSERLVDTLRSCGSGRVLARITTAGGGNVTTTLCHFGPRSLARSVGLEGGELVFRGMADIEDPAAWVWAATAPWWPVERVDIVDGRATIPVRYVDAGPLIVEVFSDDPFAFVERPQRPGGQAFKLDQVGRAHDEDPTLDALAAFLAQERNQLFDGVAAEGMWAALRVLPGTGGLPPDLRAGVLNMLSQDPRSALEALGSAGFGEGETVALMITTRLVEKGFTADETDNPLHLNTWVGSFVEIADLPSLRERASEVVEEREESLNYLARNGGDELIELLRTGSLPNARAGVFDRISPILDQRSQTELESMIAECELVPAGHLDDDSRVGMLLDVFANRGEWTTGRAYQDLDLARILRRIRDVAPELADLVDIRNEALDGVDTVKYPWALLSVQSMTLAVNARMNAHGFQLYPLKPNIRAAWAAMAELFPRLVLTDLLIADAAASHARHADLIGDFR